LPAEKNGKFTIEDVIDGLITKIVRRHPHVFGRQKVSSTKEIIANWDKIKRLEKKSKMARACGRTRKLK
jgi:tetrapyrrole methylase family protein/MazG family protein